MAWQSLMMGAWKLNNYNEDTIKLQGHMLLQLKETSSYNIMQSLSTNPDPEAQAELKSLQALHRKGQKQRLFNKSRHALSSGHT